MKHLILVTTLAFSSILFSQKLHFKVEGIKDTTVFLTKYIGSKLFYADTAIMKNGVAEFTAKKDMKPGVFAFLMPGEKYFEFIYNNEDVSIETKSPDFVPNMKIKKSEENKLFLDYILFITKEKTAQQTFIRERDKEAKGSPKIEQIQKSIDSISSVVTAYQNNLIYSHPDMLVSKMIKMSMEVTIPDYPRDEKGNIKDSSFRYKYYRAHFWDNISLKDDRLVNTPVFGQKMEYYFGKNMLVQNPDSILPVAYALIDQMDPSSDMFKFTVDYVTNTFAKSNIMGMDKVYVMMADRYYCKNDPKTGKSYAYWMPEEKLKTLCEDIAIKKHLVVGAVPPNISLRDTTDVNWKNFYSLKSDYTILYFWDPDCGHCKKTTPKLQKLYEDKLKARNVEVFAVGKATGDDFEKWKKYIRDNKLTFINVGLTETLYKAALEDARQFVPKYTNIESLNYHDTYDIYATPRVIVLDKGKKIVAKQLSISQLEDLLDHLQNIKNAPKLFPPDPEDEAH